MDCHTIFTLYPPHNTKPLWEAGCSGNLRPEGFCMKLSDAPFSCKCFMEAMHDHPTIYVCASLLRDSHQKCRLNPQVDDSSRARAIRSRLSDVKLCSEAHLICQAGFLTYGYKRLSSPSHMYHDWVMQWDIENRLSEHSDRIAQDLHLIPFSYQTCRYALDTAFSAHFYFISFCAYCQASASIFCALL